MGPGNGGRGLGSAGGALAATLAVAAVTLVMVALGGGLTKPLVKHLPHVATAQASQSQMARSQG
jgi:hypothetical protein